MFGRRPCSRAGEGTSGSSVGAWTYPARVEDLVLPKFVYPLCGGGGGGSGGAGVRVVGPPDRPEGDGRGALADGLGNGFTGHSGSVKGGGKEKAGLM